MLRNVVAVSLLALVPTLASAKQVEGVEVADTYASGGKTLKLNGAGLRKKFVVKVYVGALYVEEPSTNAQTLLSGDKAWAVQMTFKRGVDKGKIIGAYKEGFEKNSKDKLSALQAGLGKLESGLADMKEGGLMTVAYTPGKGTTITQPGGVNVAVDGKDFGDALLRNWLGGSPADDNLKEALLSGK